MLCTTASFNSLKPNTHSTHWRSTQREKELRDRSVILSRNWSGFNIPRWPHVGHFFCAVRSWNFPPVVLEHQRFSKLCAIFINLLIYLSIYWRIWVSIWVIKASDNAVYHYPFVDFFLLENQPVIIKAGLIIEFCIQVNWTGFTHVSLTQNQVASRRNVNLDVPCCFSGKFRERNKHNGCSK